MQRPWILVVRFIHKIVGWLGLFVILVEAKLRNYTKNFGIVGEMLRTASFVKNSSIQTANAVGEKMSDD